ncbi:bis(5'-nucleosyl)-tetraphosphatase [asymmetrical]-like isoform X2 [Eriocheir sinensis]|uniref:bis(5'-nucleosyl)-tetraphosphatase [asymmetrical]-like isoform X2 n=1 Tax=Eriocheir sinensis TaxID=95602 RepID=UPI0021C87493|nr:bis(5'-nucleosyl)-tetraphosphatase [asymmetrical]-like isoform X2 [Eriocheir sinensis]XP_050724708.1 bis(5'-nucleosyl)-tetraphosphatase [asymmetrical]-like isoform X2 [Eriocheir sinensis]
MSGREVRAAGLIVFRRAAAGVEYLLLQSSRKEAHWTPPKGHVDPGENDLQAAFRETEEEAGLKEQDLAVVKGFESVLKYTVNNRPKSVVYWAAELMNSSAPVIISHEHIDFRWAGVADACTLAAFPEMVSSLQECDVFLQKHLAKE